MVWDMYVGAYYSDNRGFTGKIDEVRMYNRCLSERELDTLYEMRGRGHQDIPLRRGLVLDLDFREGAGATVKDKSPYQNHGTLINAPAWVEEGGVDLESSSKQYVTLPTGITAQGEDITIAVQFTLDSSVNQMALVDIRDEIYLYTVIGSTGRISINVYDGDWQYCTAILEDAIDDGEKAVGIFTHDGITMKTYVNGRLSNTQAQGYANAVAAGTNVIGAYFTLTSSFFDGKVHKVRIYQRALSEREVRQLTEEWLNE